MDRARLRSLRRCDHRVRSAAQRSPQEDNPDHGGRWRRPGRRAPGDADRASCGPSFANARAGYSAMRPQRRCRPCRSSSSAARRCLIWVAMYAWSSSLRKYARLLSVSITGVSWSTSRMVSRKDERYAGIRRAIVKWYRTRAAQRLPAGVDRWWSRLGRGEKPGVPYPRPAAALGKLRSRWHAAIQLAHDDARANTDRLHCRARAGASAD